MSKITLLFYHSSEKQPLGPGLRLPVDESPRVHITRPDGHDSESEL